MQRALMIASISNQLALILACVSFPGLCEFEVNVNLFVSSMMQFCTALGIMPRNILSTIPEFPSVITPSLTIWLIPRMWEVFVCVHLFLV